MSLLYYQAPASASEDQWFHATVNPTWYTAFSSNYIESDFKYDWQIYTTSGNISKSKSAPRIKEGLGSYSPNSVLNSLMSYDFNPTITTYTPCPNSILGYKIKLQEYSSAISPTSIQIAKATALTVSKEGWDYNDNMLLNGTESFMTDVLSTQKVDITDYATLRCLNGVIKPINASVTSRVNELQLVVTHTDGNKYTYYTTVTNPYYNKQANTDLTVVEDMSEFLIDIPAGPANLNSMAWFIAGFQLTGQSAVSYAKPWKSTTTPLECGHKYTLRTYTFPYGDLGATSKAYNFEIDCCLDGIQLQWENKYGGFDFSRFPKVSAKNVSTTKSTFRRGRDSQGQNQNSSGDFYIGHDDYDRGETVYDIDINETYIANSDWLDAQQILDLEDLWSSKNIFAYIDSEWYPVVSLVGNQMIQSTRKGLRQYEIEFRLSNKIYR